MPARSLRAAIPLWLGTMAGPLAGHAAGIMSRGAAARPGRSSRPKMAYGQFCAAVFLLCFLVAYGRKLPQVLRAVKGFQLKGSYFHFRCVGHFIGI